MLSNFIRRNGKRKGNAGKATECRSHHKSLSTSESSQVPSPLVYDINEGSVAAQSSPLVELHLSTSNEEWFPQELLRSRSSPLPPSSRRFQNATATLHTSTRTNPSPTPSLSHSENGCPSIASRKKSIPAPIMIPGYIGPDVQIGQSSISSREFPPEKSPPNANDASVNPTSPSASENLSSISGTTLARALIASSFVLSSSEHRSSRCRSGVARQDSATLPHVSFFLSDSRCPSPVPPVPPVPATLVGVPPHPHHSTPLSGASTESEYPLSDAYITSPEMTASSRRISRIQGVHSPTAPSSSKNPPSVFPLTKSPEKGAPVPARPRVSKNSVSDGPRTTVEVPLPMHSRGRARNTSRDESILLGFDAHSLDEFDFLPPEMMASPESDSSASSIVPTTPPSKRGGANRGQWKRRLAGLNLVRNGSKVSLSDGTFTSQEVCGILSASTSELDYGELLNYDLTVSPGSSLPSSSASAGYQTFPETPVGFSPLWSSGYSSLAKSDSQVFRRRLSSMKSAGRGSGKWHSNTRPARRHVRNDGDAPIPFGSQSSSSFPRQRTPSDDPSVPEDETHTANQAQLQHPGEFLSTVRPHPLARISSSSSYLLEEEALQALARHSPSSFPSIAVGDVDDADLSDKSPTFIPLPVSTDVSPFNSPAALACSSVAVSSLESPHQISLPTSSTDTSRPHPSSHLLSPSSPSVAGSFLPTTSPCPSLDEPLPQTHPPIVPVHFSFAPHELVYHSPSPSFIPPPPYHTVVSENTARHPSATSTPMLSRTPSSEPVHSRSRQPSSTSLTSGAVRIRGRSRPPLPIGPRKPSGPGRPINSFFLGLHSRNGSASSVGSSDPAGSPGFHWRKLYSAASKPPPQFQAPPPKWRGLTLEAAQWTFTSGQLQEIVSQAIQQSSEGSALRFLRPDLLEGEIADEMQRLELQHLDVKAQFKTLSRKRWMLLGVLAGHIEGVEMNDVVTAARTVEELAEVLSALDGLADQMHDTVLQMAHLKSLRDVHNSSALAMALRKINALFVRQVAENERLQDQVETLRTERDEAWKHAEEIAQDYDALNDRVSESACGDAGAPNADGLSSTESKRSARLSAVRMSSFRQSQAGLRSCSRRRSPSNAPRPASLGLDDTIPPVPRLRVNPTTGPPATALPSGMSHGTSRTDAALALAEAQREVYEMLGLSVPPSQASSRRRTRSSSVTSRPPSPKSRPASESIDGRARGVRSRHEWALATKSVVLDDRYHVRPLAVARS